MDDSIASVHKDIVSITEALEEARESAKAGQSIYAFSERDVFSLPRLLV